MNDTLQFMGAAAPYLAIIGFLFICIKMFVSDKIKQIMCVHIMFLSGAAFVCYMVRYFILDDQFSMTLFVGFCWLFIGLLNYMERAFIKKRLS